MKTCIKCNVEKPLTEYYLANKGKAYQSRCKSCFKKHVLDNGSVTTYHSKIKGVYGIFDNNVCLYVGESQALNRRIAEHKTNINRIQTNTIAHQLMYKQLQQCPNLEFRILEECDNHKEREQYYINELKPKYNGQF